MFVEKGWFIPTVQFGDEDVFIFEDWEETPVGPYRALFHFRPDDSRTLYASTALGRDLVSSLHRFDLISIVPIASLRQHGTWRIELEAGEKGKLAMELDLVETTMLRLINPVASHTPEAIARNPLYCRLLPRLAGPILGTDPKQKIMGRTEMGRDTRFRVDRMYKISSGTCAWGGREIGPLRDCCFEHDMGAYRPISKPMASYLSLFVE
jgi:hypothetical protein